MHARAHIVPICVMMRGNQSAARFERRPRTVSPTRPEKILWPVNHAYCLSVQIASAFVTHGNMQVAEAAVIPIKRTISIMTQH